MEEVNQEEKGVITKKPSGYILNNLQEIELHKQGKDDRFEPVKKVLAFPKVTVIEQDQSLPYGNGSPIASARRFINDDEAFIVAYSDDVVFGKSAVKDLMDAFEEHPDAAAIISGQEVKHEEIKKYASISLDGEKVEGENSAAKQLLKQYKDQVEVEKAPKVEEPNTAAEAEKEAEKLLK